MIIAASAQIILGVFVLYSVPPGKCAPNWVELLRYIECSLRRLIRRPEHLIGRHCGISRQTEGHSFGDHLISESVSVTPSSVI
jgi:hypothetical protein